MADAGAAPAAAGGVKKRASKKRFVDANALVEGLLGVMQDALSAVLNADQVARAFAAAAKSQRYKDLMKAAAAAGKGGGKGGKGAGGGDGSGGKDGAVRSLYQAYTTCAMAALKAAGRKDMASMGTIGATWKKLPPNERNKIESRMGELRDRVNGALAAGAAVKSLPEELAAMDAAAGREPVDFERIILRYHDAPIAEAPAAGGGGAGGAAAAGDKAAAAPAKDKEHHTGGHKEGGHKEKKHKDKKHKEKKHREGS